MAGLADIVGGVYYAHENGFSHGVLGLVVGGIYAAGALYGARNVRACRRETDTVVAALVADAAMAMRSGGCSAVLDTAIRLAQDAPDAYVVFTHDPTFAQCF